jgi:hypothetical protein
MQQAANPPSFVMQAERERAMQFGDHEHGFGRDVISVRRDYDFRELCCQCGPLDNLRDAARNRKFPLPSKSRFWVPEGAHGTL